MKNTNHTQIRAELAEPRGSSAAGGIAAAELSELSPDGIPQASLATSLHLPVFCTQRCRKTDTTQRDAQSTAGRPTAKESWLSSPQFISVKLFTQFKLCVDIEHVDTLKNTTAREKCIFQMSTCLNSRQTCHNLNKKQ